MQNLNESNEPIGASYRWKKGLLHFDDGARVVVYDGKAVIELVPFSKRIQKWTTNLLVGAIAFFYVLIAGSLLEGTLSYQASVSSALPIMEAEAVGLLLLAVVLYVIGRHKIAKMALNMKPDDTSIDDNLLQRLDTVYRQGPRSSWFPYGHGVRELARIAFGLFLLVGMCGLILLFPALTLMHLKLTYDLKAGDENYQAGNYVEAETLYRDALAYSSSALSTSSVSLGGFSRTSVNDITRVWERLALALACQKKNDEAVSYLKRAIAKNSYWYEHPPQAGDSSFTISGYDDDDQAKKLVRLLGNYCALLGSTESQSFTQETWSRLLALTRSEKRRDRIELYAARELVRSLKRRNLDQSADELQEKLKQLKDLDRAERDEQLLPLLTEASPSGGSPEGRIALDEYVIGK